MTDAIRVKPLVREDEKELVFSETAFGFYSIYPWAKDKWHLECPQGDVQFHPALEAAKAAAQVDFEARILSALTAPADPQPIASRRQDGAKSCHQRDLSIEDAQQADPQQVAQERTFTAPYSVEWYEGMDGKWLALKHDSLVFASYAVSRWGSEQACIEAAWQHVYAPDPQSADATYNQGVRDAVACVDEEIERARIFGPHHVPILSAIKTAIHFLLRPETR